MNDLTTIGVCLWCVLVVVFWLTTTISPALARLDYNGLQDVRCRKITNEAECRSTSGCAYDFFETRKCLGVYGKSCELLRTKLSCETNYGCRWAFGYFHNKWRPTCKPFDFQLPSKQALVYPGSGGPASCASLQGRKECLEFSGCQPNKELGCRPQELVLRQSFYFLDGCTQNYDLTRCRNRTAYPYKAAFLKRIDSSWYFIDRVEVLTPVIRQQNNTIIPSNELARVFVWYAHDQVKGRYFVYDLTLDDLQQPGGGFSFSIFRYEAVQGHKICRTHPSAPDDPPIATIESILRTDPSQIIQHFGLSSQNLIRVGVAAEKTAEFVVDTGNANETATVVATGPAYLIRSVTSDLIADVAHRLKQHADCETESKLQEALTPAILLRQHIGLGDETPDPHLPPVDPCFTACLELEDVIQQQQCIQDCAREANENLTRTAITTTTSSSPLLPSVLHPRGVSWFTIETINEEIEERFVKQASNRLNQIRRLYGEFCKGKLKAPSNAKLLSQMEALISNLEQLETATLLPVDINLGNAFTILAHLDRINLLVSELDVKLSAVAADVQLASQFPFIQPIVLPIYHEFNAIRENLINPVKAKLSSVEVALDHIRAPLLAALNINELARYLVLYVSNGVDVFLARPIDIARCSQPLNNVTKEIVLSDIIPKSNTVIKNAITGLNFAREVAKQVGFIIRNVDIPALQLLLSEMEEQKRYWDNTLARIIYPLQNALNFPIKLTLPSLCKRRIEVCSPISVPCGTEICMEEAFCGTQCDIKNGIYVCETNYCQVPIPCGVKFCEKICADFDIWVLCTIKVAFPVRLFLQANINLFQTGFGSSIRPLFDAIPRPTVNPPPLPSSLKAIPPNVNGIIKQVNENVTSLIVHGVANFILEQIPDEISCGFQEFSTDSTPKLFWECPPWNRLLQALLVPPSGPFAITLKWFDSRVHLEFFVQTPNGKVISYVNPGPSRGATDRGQLDFNGASPQSIFWVSGSSPPQGVYHICLHPVDPQPEWFYIELQLDLRENGVVTEIIEGFIPEPNISPLNESGICDPNSDSYFTSVRFGP